MQKIIPFEIVNNDSTNQTELDHQTINGVDEESVVDKVVSGSSRPKRTKRKAAIVGEERRKLRDILF